MEYTMPISNNGWPSYIGMTQGPSISPSYAMSTAGYVQPLTIECPPSNQFYSYPPPVPYHGSHQLVAYNHSPASTHATLSTASFPPSPSEGYVSPASVYTPQSIASEGTRCPYKGCTSTGKFKRRTDLDRHMRTQHEADKNREDCPHGWCGRVGKNGFSRRDHLREHLREVHRQDIPYKTRRTSGNRSPTKTKNRRSNSGNSSSNKSAVQTARRA